ncbi:MAG: hypothetical protein ACLFVU_08995 [Phycisphaerae bacterium]
MKKRIFCTLLAGLAVCMLTAPAQQAFGLAGSAALEGTGTRVHPDSSLNLLCPKLFSVYTGSEQNLADAGWTLAKYPESQVDAVKVSSFDSGVAGDIVSCVYVNEAGHHLFTYQIISEGDRPIRAGNIEWSDNVCIVDCGVWDPEGDPDCGPTDTLELARGTGQVQFSFQALTADGSNVEELLEVGDCCPVFYYETTCDWFGIGMAEIHDSGSSAHQIRVLAPAHLPEPMTLLAVGLGVLGAARYARKRSRC